MIEPSAITNTAHSYIEEKLHALTEQHNIRILLAIESGSRSWGFPSQNSDYDVRFIYARSVNDYLSVEPFRDVIETPLVDDPTLGVPLDLNGWDIKKALQLAMTSNLTLCEWLTSPIHYIFSKEESDLLFNFVDDTYDLDALAYRYQSWAQNLWEETKKDTTKIKAKFYCYVLRLLLCHQSIKTLRKLPPMDLYSLCNRLELNQKIVDEIEKVITTKSSANESDLILRIKTLDEFIMSVLSEATEKPNAPQPSQDIIVKANGLFRALIGTSKCGKHVPVTT